jgi:hypothetical protein
VTRLGPANRRPRRNWEVRCSVTGDRPFGGHRSVRRTAKPVPRARYMPAIVGGKVCLRAYLQDPMPGPTCSLGSPAEGDGRVGEKRLEMLAKMGDRSRRNRGTGGPETLCLIAHLRGRIVTTPRRATSHMAPNGEMVLTDQPRSITSVFQTWRPSPFPPFAEFGSICDTSHLGETLAGISQRSM